jgi:8-oxo-dGTP pyrophosphatase MutT (NUDIX family)
MKGRSQWGAAAQEALEEAGVKGKIGRKPIGSFDYVKRGRGGQQWPCEVKVFPLEVLDQRAGWKERSERERVWFGVDDAAAAVDEPALRLLILSFALRRSTGAA